MLCLTDLFKDIKQYFVNATTPKSSNFVVCLNKNYIKLKAL